MKKVRLNIEPYIGENAFLVMGKFRAEAIRQGWTKSELKEVLDEAMDGDYDHLCETIKNRCE